ncbi:MAG: ParB/RepB/Spo0J family partition protein [Pseudomonadota bacterium]
MGVQRIVSVEDLDRIAFEDGMAAVEVAPELLGALRLRNDQRTDGPRLQRVLQSIRDRGYDPMLPIVARIGQEGRWVIIDGGHRLTAARRIAQEFWSNLFGPKVGNVYFLLFTGPNSYKKLATKMGLDPEAADEFVASPVEAPPPVVVEARPT